MENTSLTTAVIKQAPNGGAHILKAETIGLGKSAPWNFNA